MEKAHIKQAIKFIDNNLKKSYSLNSIAESIGYSAYHLSREFKRYMGKSIMEYAREKKLHEAANSISKGKKIINVAMDYGFDTHAGFTKGFTALFGCSPKEYQEHENKKNYKGVVIMDNTKILIRHICKDDVEDLWENVYSAMTPRQITEVKILPAIERYDKKEGIDLVAEVNGEVVMALPMMRLFSHPVGFLFDNAFVLKNDDTDIIMEKLLNEIKKQAKFMGISTLSMWQPENSEHTKAFMHFGFTKVFTSGSYDYLMLSI